MESKSLAPVERNSIPIEESKRSLGLAGPQREESEYGQQLSSFTALKQTKKTGTLFAVSESPLKTD